MEDFLEFKCIAVAFNAVFTLSRLNKFILAVIRATQC